MVRYGDLRVDVGPLGDALLALALRDHLDERADLVIGNGEFHFERRERDRRACPIDLFRRDRDLGVDACPRRVGRSFLVHRHPEHATRRRTTRRTSERGFREIADDVHRERAVDDVGADARLGARPYRPQELPASGGD